MDKLTNHKDKGNPTRRTRQHEILIALINQNKDLELMDADSPGLWSDNTLNNISHQDPASWIDRNRRILKKYQSLIRSAIALDALLDSEQSDS